MFQGVGGLCGVSDRGGVIFFFFSSGLSQPGEKKTVEQSVGACSDARSVLSLMPAPGSVPSS